MYWMWFTIYNYFRSDFEEEQHMRSNLHEVEMLSWWRSFLTVPLHIDAFNYGLLIHTFTAD